jgi:diguanylate cyclase (GGDEF)-like protein
MMWAGLNKDVELLLAGEGARLPGDPVHAGPIRVLLLSSEYRTARLIDELLHATWPRAHLVTHATWDAAAAQAVLDHPGCCVLLDAAPVRAGGDCEDPMALLEYVQMSAPGAAVVLLCPNDDERFALDAVRAGAQDCLSLPELDVVRLRRALMHAIERKRAESQLAHQALHDQLTGLPNRALFLDRLGVALERARRSGGQLAVLFLDFDNFKQINDSRGHAAGDRLLSTLGGRLSGLLRPMDTVARFGGDEFTFLFEDLSTEREVVLIADRICQAASLPVEMDGVELSVTVSVGIAMIADPTVSPETVIREADAAMYRAKERGRSRYELFDEESRRRAIERIELEAAIRRAVAGGELRVHYQPNLILADTAAPGGVEALVRWQHPTRGLIAARDFIKVAEDIGMVVPLGRFVLEEALARLVRWRARWPDMTLSLNISAQQMADPGLPATLSEALRRHEIEPVAICLEIAESAMAEDPDGAADALERLKATGVRIALDDFGLGASSLARLREMPIDALKIHESFIGSLGSSAEDASVVSALVDLGHALGLTVVAEGVESECQLEQLRELGCDAAQGYAIGHPVGEEQLEAQLVAAV